MNYTCSIHSCFVISLSLSIRNKSLPHTADTTLYSRLHQFQCFDVDTPWSHFSEKIWSKKNRTVHFSPRLDRLWYAIGAETQLCSRLKFNLTSCNKTSSALFLFIINVQSIVRGKRWYFCAHTYPVIFSDDFRAFLCYQCVYVFLHVQI